MDTITNTNGKRNILNINNIKTFIGHVRLFYTSIKFFFSHLLISLKDTISSLGHPDSYRDRKGVRAAIKPISLSIVAATAISLMSVTESQAQARADTIWATGIFSTKNIETGNSVGNISLYLTPESMAMHTPDTTYEFITDGNGLTGFELPVYIDSTVHVSELIRKETNIFPNIGSEMNTFFPKIQRGTIEVYNMKGQLVKTQEFNADHDYLALDKLSTGMYVYNIQTSDGVQLGGKFMKQNTPLQGPAARPSNTSSTVKNVEMHEATYWAKWVDPEGDFHTDSTLITLEEGENDLIFFYMTPDTVPVPQHQDIQGIAKDENNNWSPMQGVTAILYDQTNNETYTTVTGADGKYTFEDIPAGSSVFLSVGGVDDYYSLNDQEYTVPSSFEQYSDTLATFFDATVYAVRPDIQNLTVLVGQTNSGTTSTERKYWFSDEVSSSAQASYNSWFSQYDAQTNDYTHVQTTDESEADIKIYNGANNTNTSSTMISTPLGDYYPVILSKMYINPVGYGVFTHEVGQADGKSQCSGNGYLSSNPPPTGPNAEDIACGELDKLHWVDNVQVHERTYFDLNNISLSLDSKSPEYKKK